MNEDILFWCRCVCCFFVVVFLLYFLFMHSMKLSMYRAQVPHESISTKTKLNGNDETKTIFYNIKWRKNRTPIKLNKFVVACVHVLVGCYVLKVTQL